MEYILPQSDFVVVHLHEHRAQKRFPRILENSQNACVVMVGPATPLARRRCSGSA